MIKKHIYIYIKQKIAYEDKATGTIRWYGSLNQVAYHERGRYTLW